MIEHSTDKMFTVDSALVRDKVAGDGCFSINTSLTTIDRNFSAYEYTVICKISSINSTYTDEDSAVHDYPGLFDLLFIVIKNIGRIDFSQVDSSRMRINEWLAIRIIKTLRSLYDIPNANISALTSLAEEVVHESQSPLAREAFVMYFSGSPVNAAHNTTLTNLLELSEEQRSPSRGDQL